MLIDTVVVMNSTNYCAQPNLGDLHKVIVLYCVSFREPSCSSGQIWKNLHGCMFGMLLFNFVNYVFYFYVYVFL
jgi:hypothetical protein